MVHCCWRTRLAKSYATSWISLWTIDNVRCCEWKIIPNWLSAMWPRSIWPWSVAGNRPISCHRIWLPNSTVAWPSMWITMNSRLWYLYSMVTTICTMKFNLSLNVHSYRSIAGVRRPVAASNSIMNRKSRKSHQRLSMIPIHSGWHSGKPSLTICMFTLYQMHSFRLRSIILNLLSVVASLLQKIADQNRNLPRAHRQLFFARGWHTSNWIFTDEQHTGFAAW